jgi:1-acyl-sn-glycerol-3-phosphate acyltransferase
MSLAQRFLLALFRGLTGVMYRVDGAALERVPPQGPMILVTNHVHIFEIPVIYTLLQPRTVHGLVLSSRWRNPVVAWGLNACGAIPLVRGGINLDAIQRALDALQSGGFLIVAPEGTRSHDGQLQSGHQGIVPLALKSGAPLLPVGYFGGERYPENLRHLRRTDFHLVVGTPFRLVSGGNPLTSAVRQQMVEEIMYRLAAILPEAYRGKYAQLNLATQEYLAF